jgi:hypothetical protein
MAVANGALQLYHSAAAPRNCAATLLRHDAGFLANFFFENVFVFNISKSCFLV